MARIRSARIAFTKLQRLFSFISFIYAESKKAAYVCRSYSRFFCMARNVSWVVNAENLRSQRLHRKCLQIMRRVTRRSHSPPHSETSQFDRYSRRGTVDTLESNYSHSASGPRRGARCRTLAAGPGNPGHLGRSPRPGPGPPAGAAGPPPHPVDAPGRQRNGHGPLPRPPSAPTQQPDSRQGGGLALRGADPGRWQGRSVSA